MSNTNVFETKLSDRMQVVRYSTPVYAAQASFEERPKLNDGQSVVRPTFSRLYADTYVRGTNSTPQDYTEGTETLTVNTSKIITLAVDDLDLIQHKPNLMAQLAGNSMSAINKQVDADYLGEVVNAVSTVDAADFGGASGAGVVVDTSNVLGVYSAALRKLQLQDIDITGMVDPRPQAGNMKPGGTSGFANCSPYFYEQLSKSLAGRETVDGDMVGKNGYKGHYFGFDNFVTTNGTWTGVLTIASTPTDGDTVTINGVVFTFKTTLGSTAGNVAIGGSADAARLNLSELINAPSTTDAGQVALSAANARLLNRMTATDAASPNTLTLVAKGYGYVVVSETLTDATDAWTSEISSQMFGQKGCVDMVLQAKPQVKTSDIPLQIGKYVKPYVLYGQKTFTEGAQAMVQVKVDSSSWT